MTTAILHRDMIHPPVTAVRGEGVYVYDKDGKAYIDGSGGAAVSCLGHNHPRVREAIQKQLDILPYAHTGFFTNEPAEALAQKLVDRTPDGFGQGRVAYLGSGSEAMEAALKLARQHFYEQGQTERHRIIARGMSYHGNTLGALAIGGHAGRRKPYAPMLMEVSHISPCYAYRLQEEGEGDEEFGQRVADELDAEIQRLGPNTVAAFVAETVGGATQGAIVPAPGYFTRIREICDRYGILFIADEVMCGMGRTGTLYACEQESVTPDLFTIAKGLGAGYQPIAAVIASEKTVQPILDGSGLLGNGHTYMSHAAACAGAMAVIDTIEQDDLLANVRGRGEQLTDLFRERFGQHPNVGDIRGRGLFQALEFVENRETKQPFDRSRKFAGKLKNRGMANGLICYPGSGTIDGSQGDHVLIAPAFITENQHIEEIVDKLEKSINEALTH